MSGPKLDDQHLSAIIRAVAGAALLLDATGSVLEVNAGAKVALARGETLRAPIEGRVVLGRDAILPEHQFRAFVNETIAASAELGAGSSLSLVVPRRDAMPPFVLLATSLPSGATGAVNADANRAHVLLQLWDPLSLRDPDGELLRAVFGLTRGEAMVAVLVCKGVLTPEIAGVLGVRATTVRTHLARCFDKTGVRSQVALARLVSALPVSGGSSDDAVMRSDDRPTATRCTAKGQS